MAQPSNTNRSVATRAQALYVRALLRLLPLLISLFRHTSKRIRAEIGYLRPSYTFQLAVAGAGLSCTCRLAESGAVKRVPPARIARDVEPGSGLPVTDADRAQGRVAVDYVITFRSLAYAFDCFSASMTLKDALAQRAMSTRGPNDTGVALTYLFTALLRMFFGWRAAYRKAEG